METWDLWYPNAASDGLAFARGRMDAGNTRLLVHAAPDVLRVEVRDDTGHLVAAGDDLRRDGPRLPMTRLRRTGDRIEREDTWPDATDIGHRVILPGGEIGTLQHWWNAADGSEWRWRVEFYNHE